MSSSRYESKNTTPKLPLKREYCNDKLVQYIHHIAVCRIISTVQNKHTILEVTSCANKGKIAVEKWIGRDFSEWKYENDFGLKAIQTESQSKIETWNLHTLHSDEQSLWNSTTAPALHNSIYLIQSASHTHGYQKLTACISG